MPDFMQGVEAFQKGADWRQRFRANKQIEKARDQALEAGGRELNALRGNESDMLRLFPEETAGMSAYHHEGLQDPFAFKLMDWFKSRKGKKKAKTQAIDTGDDSGYMSSNPGVSGEAPAPPMAGGEPGSIGNPEEEYPESQAQAFPMEGFADGGSIDMEALNAKQLRQAQLEILKDKLSKLPGRAKEALATADEGLGKFTGRAAEGSGLLKRAASGAKRVGAAGALAGTAITAANTPTEDYRERFGLETNDPSLAGDIGVRALGAASDLGSALTFGAADRFYRDKQHGAEATAPEAPQGMAIDPLMGQGGGAGGGAMSADVSSRRRGSALPSSPTTPEVADFSDLDIDAKEVPDMKTNDWVKYRAQVLRDATRRGQPVDAAMDRVTEMQVKGFINYGQQGLALQQAGNTRGAMAAYRAAFQYFPNGNDVEFGVHKGKDGRPQIVGVGLDEKTGKRVPGTEMIMDPERISTLMANFKNPQAFAMWTKDHRAEQFRERQYQEVTKPLAQATADYQANNSEANVLRAENAQLRGGAGGAGAAANMRTAERTFRERLGQMGMTDEANADFLASVMSQIKAANPSVPDNVIIQTIMTAQRDGSLQKRLAAMQGAQAPRAQTQVQPRSAIPVDEGGADDPAMVGLSPEEIDWANRPAQ